MTQTTRHVRLVTEVPGPRSREIMARKEQVVARAMSVHVPVAIQEGHGALVTDVDGNVFIDLAGGMGCMNVGHSHPRVVQAIQESAARFTHTDFTVIMYESYIRLAERLTALAPGDFPKKAAFFNSGAEAVENAVKIARKYTGRRAIITLEGAFHGRTNMAMALTSKVKPYKEGFAPFAPEIYRVPTPYVYRRPAGMSEAEYVRFCADFLERALITQVAPEEVAAIILEPVQGEGGFVPLHPDYLARVSQLAKKHGFLVIADEIQTGFGRTGTFFACEQLGLVPDLMCVGKSLAAGMPLTGVIGRAEVMDAPGDSTLGGTYVGNPVACAAAHAVLDVMEEENLVSRAREIGDLFRRRFQALAVQLESIPGSKLQIGEIRGLGAMIGVELVTDRATRAPATAQTAEVVTRAWQRGVVAVKCGIYGNTLRMLVPLVITDDQLDEALDILGQICVEIARGE